MLNTSPETPAAVIARRLAATTLPTPSSTTVPQPAAHNRYRSACIA
jgi:hypothetical protein